MRYKAPDHVSSISLACGEFPVENGFANIPDDLGAGDITGLAANGFQPAPRPAAAPAVPVAPATGLAAAGTASSGPTDR